MPNPEDASAVTERLFQAMEAGDVETVEALIEADPGLARARNREGASALTWAAYYRREVICDLLLEAGVQPDVFEAAILGEKDCLRGLLAADRSRVDRYSFDGWTPLHLAAHFGRTEALRTLLSHGANHRAVAKNGIANQPLQAAAAGGHRESVALLLKAGADPDASSHGGVTALHTAAQHGDLAMVRILLEAGADPGRETEGGKTARDFAEEKGHADVARALEAAGEGA